jgi:hypothetical protein
MFVFYMIRRHRIYKSLHGQRTQLIDPILLQEVSYYNGSCAVDKEFLKNCHLLSPRSLECSFCACMHMHKSEKSPGHQKYPGVSIWSMRELRIDGWSAPVPLELYIHQYSVLFN